MATLFGAEENRAFAEIERIYGESFEFRPQVAAPGGGRRSADPDREVRTITGLLDSPLFKSNEFGSEARGATPVRMSRMSISFDERQLPDDERPQRFDKFKRLETGMLYEAGTPERDGEGRWKVPVTELGREST